MRALVKLSSALNDADALKDAQEYKPQMKKDLYIFSEFFYFFP